MKFLTVLCSLAFVVSAAAVASAAPTDDIADALVQGGTKAITADSLPADFDRLTKFVRHDGNGMVLFSDGGMTDGYIRHAQARFDTRTGPRAGAKMPLFSVAFELVNQDNFTFEGLAAALAQRLGTPSASSNQTGAVFRTWLLKHPEGRSFTIATSQASDNGDPITIVQLIQK
ncbi:MAG: hypothetical protein JWM91_2205 [Rhodospirillales bacterium]|nr:hypothetical protein [Rhodospirillales bacterium]